MPERFDLTYVGSDGEKHRPVMIHRVIFGSIERFIAILTEHFAGAFPAWLAPVQVKLLSITDRSNEYIHKLMDEFTKSGIRAECDLRNEKIGYKIREAQLEKINYMLVIGDKEVENGSVAVRSRKEGDMGVIKAEEFKGLLLKEIREKAL
jgi:threonyl-tRNA synthetase